MFFEAHRLSIFTPRSLDVDVVLDLMIHDLDIVLKFANSPVREVRAVGLPILSPKVDIANVRVEFESGCVANFTASRVSTERVRKLRFFEPRQYVSIDYARQDLLVIGVDAGARRVLRRRLRRVRLDAAALAQLAAGGHPSPGLSFAKPEVTPGEPLRLEVEAFLDAVRTRETAAGHCAAGTRRAGARAGDSGVDGCPCAPRRVAGFFHAECIAFMNSTTGLSPVCTVSDKPTYEE